WSPGRPARCRSSSPSSSSPATQSMSSMPPRRRSARTPGPAPEAADMRAIRTALRLPGLGLLLGAGLISLTGDWVLRVGLAYYIYALTGSTLASATMLLASFVPQIVLSSLAGALVDRWDRTR